MHYTKTGPLDMPPREPDEAPCTPEQAVELARYCPNERFENIRSFGAWQAGKMIAEVQRIEKQFYEEVCRTEAAQAQQSNSKVSFLGIVIAAVYLFSRLCLLLIFFIFILLFLLF
ncbi:MAG: hypothetical protein NTV49_13540 [Kiritimatiellaeota bacterium]|nr:hypothetical protein [Kiritimatiellota bacterium]